jgi:hypothetical protein
MCGLSEHPGVAAKAHQRLKPERLHRCITGLGIAATRLPLEKPGQNRTALA